MTSNLKYPIVLFLASFVLLLGATLLRLMHWPGVQIMSIGMLITQTMAIASLMSIFLKFRYSFLLYFASFILFLTGLALIIMHWPGGLFITYSMILVQIISISWLITIIIVKTPKA
jgi:hypothetical protein